MNNYSIRAYAQEGEDLVLKEIFNYFESRKPRDRGFYVDIGAHHPFKLSNTCIFYERDWHGINVDANPDSMYLFKKYRTRDSNLTYGVSNISGEFEYYMFENSALNSFNKELSYARKEKVIAMQMIQTVTLKYILDNYLPDGQEIDFLSIDVEGLDYEVLISNDWDKYKPKVILIESLLVDINQMLHSQIYTYLNALGYQYFSKTVRTHFFLREDIYKKRIVL